VDAVIRPEDVPGLAELDSDAPVFMINLLKFREPGGVESYLQYGVGVTPLLERAGATVRFAGEAPTVVFSGDGVPWWDVILVVEYPSPTAFLDMVTSDEYAQVAIYRENALERGDLIATTGWNFT
jgi:uncharacterized protein (DUF1330 family)